MPQFGRKTIKRSIDVIEIFLKVKGYLDEKGNITEKAEFMLGLDAENNLVILKPRKKEFNLLLKNNRIALLHIAHMKNLNSMSTKEIKNELIKRRVI